MVNRMASVNLQNLPIEPPSSSWMQLHGRACRVYSDRVLEVGLYALQHCGLFLRRCAPIDYIYITCKRTLNKVSQWATHYELFASEELKTHSQREKEQKIEEMRLVMGEDSPYARFSRETAKLVNDLFPKIISQQMSSIPLMAESSFMYRLWLPYRYLNYQFDRRTNYRDRVLQLSLARIAERWYTYATTNFAHALLSKENIDPILNFEYVFAKICEKLKPHIRGEVVRDGIKMSDVILGSFARSIELLQKCDIHSQDFCLQSDAMIARLGWYKKNNALPPGVPDPEDERVRLNSSNLEQELDSALYNYLESLSIDILDKMIPKNYDNPFLDFIYSLGVENAFNNSFLYFLYWLEGKEILMKLLSYLIAELGVKQVSDPHQLAIAILTALGRESADFEIDGFGRGKMNTIFETGEKMIRRHLAEKGNAPADVIGEFLQVNLKHRPENMEGGEQRKEAKEILAIALRDLLYDAIKPEAYRHQGGLKDIRKMVQQVPFLGGATILLNTLYSTFHFSFAYYFMSKEQKEQSQDSCIAYVLKNIWGMDYTEKLSNKTVALLYHPAWRLVVLQLIHDVTSHIFKKPQEPNEKKELPKQANESSTNDHLRIIATFIFKHYTDDVIGNIADWLKIPLDSVVGYVLSDEVIDSWRKNLSAPEKPFLENGMESGIPSINETDLYLRVAGSFHREWIFFKGDSKFWELFVREYLNRATRITAKNLDGSTHACARDLAEVRSKLVQEMLNMEIAELRKKLLSLPEDLEEKEPTVTRLEEQAEIVPDYMEEVIKREPTVTRSGPQGKIFSDYVGAGQVGSSSQ